MTTAPVTDADILALFSHVERVTILTPKQREVQDDPDRFKVMVCGRAAGKTSLIGKKLLDTAKARRNCNNAYVTGTRRMAKNIIWPILLRTNESNGLGFTPHHGDLTMTHPTSKGRIQLSGANNVVEVDKLRGQDWHNVAIDESQSLGKTLKLLVNDIIVPRLLGSLWLAGTPGPAPSGPFWDFWQAAQKGKGWKGYHFTMADNPHHLAKLGEARGKPYTFEEVIKEECDRRGVSANDPSIQREFFGIFARDLDALVCKLTERNYYTEVPTDLDEYVIGVDIGHDDADAISVLGWKWVSDTPRLWLVEEIINRKTGVADLDRRLQSVYQRYKPMAVAIDMGALGKKISVDLQEHIDVPLEAFDKSSKTGRALMLRGAVDRGHIMVRQGGPFDEDCKLLQWEYDEAGNRRISEKAPDDKAFHSDIFDSVLGGYLCSMAHRATAPVPKMTAEETMREERRERFKKQRDGGGDGLFGASTTDDLYNDGGELWAK